ncbi:MAG: tetratricopeptide repeat protein [Gammaproteobacteria bacterium]|nr:tetratricopeptide repeat protein [Gammaproteobacteria bacterium]
MITRRSTSAILCVVLALTLQPGRAAAAEPTVVQDAHYGEVLYYFYQEDYFPAIVRLLAAQQSSQLANHDAEAELLLGGLYLSYGHHLHAAEIFERLLADSVDVEIRDRTWFFLAKIWHQRGYLAESQNGLENIEGTLPGSMEAERQMLQAQIYIDAGDHDRAIALLQDWRGKTEWSSYARYNLGVAMVRSGRVNAAADILESLGSIQPYNEELSSLRDKANLALGYAFLQDEQPLAAKPALQRVRLQGPFSNKALLGVGWADAQIQNYHRALVPWMELRGRDLLDSAVQESMLAIPNAMAQLESISQAADYYLNAIEAFYEETTRIDSTIAHIESGGMFDDFLALDAESTTGWFWKLEELPDGPESRYLLHLLATHQFQEGLKNYRDLSYLNRNLDRWQQSIGVYSDMLDTREIAYAERLPRVQQSLSVADLDGMSARKLEFDARLNTIEENHDVLALATEHEFALWGEITALERNPALKADIPEAEDVRDKVRLLKGTLQWTLEKEFKERLWKVKRDLRRAGEALVETHRSRRQIDESIRVEPQMFGSMRARVQGLNPRIESLRTRVQVALAEQGGFMRDIAVDELQAQKRRLDTYTVQARFALAAIYDLSATADETIVGDAGK